jgi:perosamine synthetase
MIAVNEPLLNGNELRYVSECVTTGWISSAGKLVTEFENK